MDTEVILGEEEAEEKNPTKSTDPETFFVNSALRMVYQTNNFFIPQIRDLIKRKDLLNLRPEYQRRLRWNTRQKSKLIESLLLNIPIPPIFLYESDEARYEVMDGQQRLNAIREFIDGEYALSGLPILNPLEGFRYSQCPPRVKRALDRSTLSAIVLLLESEAARPDASGLKLADIRRFIFDRLNTGGTKLNPQEIRNALNPGVFNKVLIDISRFNLFTKVFEIPPYIEDDPEDFYENQDRRKNNLYATMQDCQLVLRYFALKEESNIRGSMKAMLDRAMEIDIAEAEEESLKQDYKERFKFLYELFDGQPFRLPGDEKGRKRISAAIYDASMVAINNLWDSRSEISQDKVNVQKRMKGAMQDSERLPILTGQQNTANAVRERIKLMHWVLTNE